MIPCLCKMPGVVGMGGANANVLCIRTHKIPAMVGADAFAHFPPPKWVWGPRRWYRLHLLAIGLCPQPSPEQKRDALRRLWEEVRDLPCQECKGHAARYLLAHPPTLESGNAAERWVFDFHNAVNARVGNPLLSWEDYKSLYAQERALADCGVGCRRALRPASRGLGATLALLAQGQRLPQQGGPP